MKRLPFTLLVVAALLFAGVLPRGWRAAFAQETFPPSPSMRAFPDQDAVDGWFWPLGADVHLAIYRPADAGTPSFEMDDVVEVAPWDENETNLWFGFQGQFDLQRGDKVTLTGASYETWLIVPDLWVTTVDVDTDLVAGTAEPGMQVHVFVGGGGEIYILADDAGNWSANFADIAFDLQPGMCGAAEAWSQGIGNSSIFDWCAPAAPPTPWLRAHPVWDSVDGWHWPQDATLHLAIDDPSTPEQPDVEMDMPGEVDLEVGSVWFALSGVYDLKAGDHVTLSDGTTTRDLVVSVLSIEVVDVEADTAAGHVEPGATVRLPAGPDTAHYVTADESGAWFADFHDIGFDLTPGMTVIAEAYDQDRDLTSFEWSIPAPPPAPWLIAFPDQDAVEGWQWPEGETIYLAIDDPATPDSPDFVGDAVAQVTSWGDPRTFFRIDFPGVYDLKADDIVMLSYGDFETTHVVRNLSVTGVDMENDTVAGTADPGTEVDVRLHNAGDVAVVVTAQGDGTWLADWAGVWDLAPGSGVRPFIWDENGNATAVDWWVPNPYSTAFTTFNEVEGWNWPLGATVHLTVDDPATTESPDVAMDQEVTLTPWGSGQSWVWFQLAPYDLKEGDVVVMTDGTTTRTHTVRKLAITGADAAANTIAGLADPDQEVVLWSWNDPEGRRFTVTAEAAGVWQGDFDTVGYDVVPGDPVMAEVWDETGNATQAITVVFAPAPPPTPITKGLHVRVPADAGWVDSGVMYTEGWPIRVTAEGQVLTAPPKDFQGAHTGPDGITPCSTFEGSACLLDGAPYGALIGKIGANGMPFVIGSSSVLYQWTSGELYLAVNDNLGWHWDNKGAYMVLISR